jgi:hypothetical protein
MVVGACATDMQTRAPGGCRRCGDAEAQRAKASAARLDQQRSSVSFCQWRLRGPRTTTPPPQKVKRVTLLFTSYKRADMVEGINVSDDLQTMPDAAWSITVQLRSSIKVVMKLRCHHFKCPSLCWCAQAMAAPAYLLRALHRQPHPKPRRHGHRPRVVLPPHPAIFVRLTSVSGSPAIRRMVKQGTAGASGWKSRPCGPQAGDTRWTG